MSSTFPVRFANPATRHRLRLMAELLDTSMNQLVISMIERELDALSVGMESELERTLERLRQLTPADIERSLDEWAALEGQDDPIVARAVVTAEDEFAIAEAFALR